MMIGSEFEEKRPSPPLHAAPEVGAIRSRAIILPGSCDDSFPSKLFLQIYAFTARDNRISLDQDTIIQDEARITRHGG